MDFLKLPLNSTFVRVEYSVTPQLSVGITEARKDLSIRSCKTESVLCTARIGQASGSSLYPEAEWTLLPATRTLLSFNKRPEETVFPLTRYNLGSSTVRGAVLGNVLLKLSYLTRIQIALLHNSPC
ncbi:LOW QUALITY PROTEIN: BH3-like motif-containing cell death inducer [Ailuropoda melanoleuca]|uniref:LOW QUALITY PROTEIN: BH3-like motif-containing cell death inducer n=1 Tax=Ailuropoda melanoleuca TaxID=9646 RepID=UPI001494D5AE|nr:LOW QUALITY PROTEIN: BH3-like motif-containing cell death inducer [Ailuropoda melanoleuca]